MCRQFLIFAACVFAVQGYNILVVFPVPSHSHATLGRGVVRSIMDHIPNAQVTFLCSYPRKDPQKGVTEIDLSHIQSLASINMIDEHNRKPDFNLVRAFAKNITTMLFETDSVRELMRTGKFDAVVSEWFFTDVYAGLPKIFNCPWIQVSGTIIHPHLEMITDSVSSPAVFPLMMNDLSIPMDFWSRVKNTFTVSMMVLSTVLSDWKETAIVYDNLYREVAKSRKVDLPDFQTALEDTSVLFVNSHPSVSYAQSMPPNVIEVGGYHIDEVIPKLPEDLQRFLDNAKEGVVYFSMGSVLKSSKLPAAMRRELLQVLSEIPCTVLWKFEEELGDLPKNVHIMKWVPQQSVLAHPNIKAFITHGGLLSTLEAVHFGVPLVAVPVFGDQPANADRAVRNGYAVKVTFGPNAPTELRGALKEILGDAKYHRKAKELSKLFRSRPITPSKTIAHYIKLSIDTNGAHHLRSKARLYPFYQRMLLDQLALILAAILVVVILAKKIIKKFTMKPVSVKKGKKKN